jgi:hypothetical protein
VHSLGVRRSLHQSVISRDELTRSVVISSARDIAFPAGRLHTPPPLNDVEREEGTFAQSRPPKRRAEAALPPAGR